VYVFTATVEEEDGKKTGISDIQVTTRHSDLVCVLVANVTEVEDEEDTYYALSWEGVELSTVGSMDPNGEEPITWAWSCV